jgi:hypothetical protein
MAATPKSGTFIFRGISSGRTYIKDIYVSDVAGASITFDDGAGAGASSATFTTFNEDVLLEDFSMVTGTADTTRIRLTANGSPKGDILRYSIHLTTLNNRPKLAIGFKAASRISAIQVA